MSQFKPGETSQEVTDKKNSITKSILKKAKLIDKIDSPDDIPESLEICGHAISQDATHKWSDESLGIIAYSRNTAHSKHNSSAFKLLLQSIDKANKRLSSRKKSSSKSNKDRLTDNITNQIRKENEELRIALAEVYRAYMQLVDNYREDRQVDESIRKLILNQAHILGQHRVWEVK